MSLELVLSEDLIAELAKRFETMIFYGQNGRGQHDHGHHHMQGETLILVGVLEREKYVLLQDSIDGSIEGDDD